METITATELMQKVKNKEFEILTDFFGSERNHVEVEIDSDNRTVELFQVLEQTEETMLFFFTMEEIIGNIQDDLEIGIGFTFTNNFTKRTCKIFQIDTIKRTVQYQEVTESGNGVFGTKRISEIFN